MTWSDHAPIVLTYVFSEMHSSGTRVWKLNESLLQTPEILVEVTRELQYFQMNDQRDCDPGILWEAHKVVIRGVLIKHGARIKKQRTEKLESLLSEIHTLESRLKQDPTLELERDLMALRRQVTYLLRYKT